MNRASFCLQRAYIKVLEIGVKRGNFYFFKGGGLILSYGFYIC